MIAIRVKLPAQPTTEVLKCIGGLWMQSEGQGSMPDGTPATTVMTLGYDPRTKRFVSTFIGSMMTHLWHYEGELDASKKILTLNAEGPSFASPGKLSKYQDIIEIIDNDHRILRSQFQSDDGKWNPFMVGHYYRKK